MEPKDKSISLAMMTRVNGIAINAKYGVVVMRELYMSYAPQVNVDLQKKNAQRSKATKTMAICRAYLRNSFANLPLCAVGESGLVSATESI
jgi:hypothetical protein